MRQWMVMGLAVLMMAGLAACSPPTDNILLPTVMQLPTATEEPTPSVLPVPLAYNQPANADLSETSAAEWTFEAAAGDTVQLRALGEGVQPALTLFSPAGEVLATGAEMVEAVIPLSGVYRLRAEAAAGLGTIEVGLTSDQQPAPAPPTLTPIPVLVGVPTPTPALVAEGDFLGVLSDGQTQAGEFALASAPHLYSFEAQAGQFLLLALDSVSGGAQPTVTVLSPVGEPVAADMLSDNGGGALLRNVRLDSAGTYTVRLTSTGNPGTYTIRLDLSEQAFPVTPTVVITPTAIPQTPVLTPEYLAAERGVRLSPNTPVRDELSAGGVNTHSFYAYQGDVLAVGVVPTPGSTLAPSVELVDPDGNLVGTATGANTRPALFAGHVVPLEGPYTVYVTGVGGSSGAYLIAFGSDGTYADRMRGALDADTPVISAFDGGGVADMWHIYLDAGDVVSVEVLPLDGVVAPVLELVRADGELLGIDRESAGARSPRLNGVAAQESGFHYLRVRPAEPTLLGAYQLTWRYLNIAPTPTPPPGTLPVVSLDGAVAPGEYVFVPFYGLAGQVVTISVESAASSLLDPVASLIAPSGQSIGSSDDASPETLNAYFEATLPEDGTYQVRVNGYLSGGQFSLRVEQVFR